MLLQPSGFLQQVGRQAVKQLKLSLPCSSDTVSVLAALQATTDHCSTVRQLFRGMAASYARPYAFWQQKMDSPAGTCIHTIHIRAISCEPCDKRLLLKCQTHLHGALILNPCDRCCHAGMAVGPAGAGPCKMMLASDGTPIPLMNRECGAAACGRPRAIRKLN